MTDKNLEGYREVRRAGISRSFFYHVIVYLVIAITLLVLGVMKIITIGIDWFYYPLIFWGCGIGFHYLWTSWYLDRWLTKREERLLFRKEAEKKTEEIFKPNYFQLQKFLSRLIASRKSDDSQQKKVDLEEFSEYLFSCLEGFECIDKDRRVADHEIDRVFCNRNTSDALLSRMGPFIMVECKNIALPVSTRDLGHFINGLRASECNFGIFISTAGFSGLKRGSYTLADCGVTLRDAKHDGIIVLPIDLEDLTDIAERKKGLIEILWDKYYAITKL
jgi:hypothetical protein